MSLWILLKCNDNILRSLESGVRDHFMRTTGCLVDVSGGVNSGLGNTKEDEGSGDRSNSTEPSGEIESSINIVTDRCGVDVALGGSSKESRKSFSLLAFKISQTILVSVFNIGTLQRDDI